MIQNGYSSEARLWVVVEPIHKQNLGVYISRHRNMIVAEAFLNSLIKIYGKHTVYSDGGTWYPEACASLGLKHILHSSYENSIVERTIEYLKDRTEAFDDYFQCISAIYSMSTNGQFFLCLCIIMVSSNLLLILLIYGGERTQPVVL